VTCFELEVWKWKGLKGQDMDECVNRRGEGERGIKCRKICVCVCGCILCVCVWCVCACVCECVVDREGL